MARKWRVRGIYETGSSNKGHTALVNDLLFTAGFIKQFMLQKPHLAKTDSTSNEKMATR